MLLSKDETQAQSNAAWGKWKYQWIDNAERNGRLDRILMKELINAGKDRKLIQAAFGYSLSKNIKDIKERGPDYDVMCCDKAFGYLMANGIVPKYCVVADANVSLDWIDGADTSKTTLIANVASSHKWVKSWKGPLVLYTNWDNIGTARILGMAGKVYDTVPASSNVSNAQIVFASQVFNYDCQLLVGYDYSWDVDGKYYASKDSDKRYWMHMVDSVSPYGGVAKTSHNLMFSCKWMIQYLMKFKQTKVINCSEAGIMELPLRMPLKEAYQKLRGK